MRQAIATLVQALAGTEFDVLEADGRSGRLTAEELRRAVADYGRTIVPLPAEAWDLVDVYPVEGHAGECALDVPLWTAEEGRSDLTLSLRARESGSLVEIEVEDLHVL